MHPSVGAVVPCKDESATLERCLASLRAQSPGLTRIVVADNGSTDGSLELARRGADVVLALPGSSIAGLRNEGARAVADLDVLAFVDADCELAPGWLAAGLAALERADLVGSRSLAAADAPWVARRWAAIESRQAHTDSRLWSQHLLVRREVFESLGGFDETMVTGEDADLSARVAAAGRRVELVDGMVATHHGFPGTLRRFLRRELWHTREPGWYARMSPRSRALVVGTAAWCVLGAGALAASATGRQAGAAPAWLVGSLLAVPVVGLLGGRSGRTAVADGTLLAVWSLVRVARLPRELARPA